MSLRARDIEPRRFLRAFALAAQLTLSACADCDSGPAPATSAHDASAGADGGPAPCGAEPERMASLSGPWSALAIDQEAVYLAGNGIVRMAKRPGAELERVIESLAQVQAIALLDDQVIWLPAGGAGRTLFTAAKSDPLARAVQPPAGAEAAFEHALGEALAAAESSVFAAFELGEQRHAIVRVARGSTRFEVFAEVLGPRPLQLIADDDRVFFGLAGTLSVWDANGRGALAARRVARPVHDERFVYGLADPTLDASGAPLGQPLVRLPKDTLAFEPLATLPSEEPIALATDRAGAYVYWTDPSGAIGRVPKEGGPAEQLAATGPYDDDDFDPLIALDDDSLYWIGGEPGMRASDEGPLWLYRMCR